MEYLEDDLDEILKIDDCHKIRQEYAKVALEGLLANPNNQGRWDAAGFAHVAFKIAEAMILEDAKYD